MEGIRHLPLGAELQQVVGDGSPLVCLLLGQLWFSCLCCAPGAGLPQLPTLPDPSSPASSRQPGCGLTRLWPPEVERDMCVTSPQFCLGVLTLHSWNLGECSVGRSALDREFLNWALGPSGTGLGNREAGLIFSQRSKYCPPYFSTGSPGMTWEPAFPEILCFGGGGLEEQGCLAFFL